jgi:hypothetical protein
MSTYLPTGKFCDRRRGVVAIQVGVMMVVLIGFAAMTVDVGTLYNTRADLQRTADAAALAGASAYTTDEMMSVRMETGGSGALGFVNDLILSRSTEYASLNPTFLASSTKTKVATSDITAGYLKLDSASEALHTNPQPWEFNAVHVMVRREADGLNGSIPLFFAPIFGKLVGESTASAVAVFDDRVSGFTPGDPGSANLLPFAVQEDIYDDQRQFTGGDQWAYDTTSQALPKNRVSDGPDDVREVKLYPWPLSGGGADGSGNFGFLNVGTENQGASAEANQILYGITPAEIEAEIGTPEPIFFDESGGDITYDISGSPGLTASHEAAVAQLMGQIVGFFIYSTFENPGANNVYTITGIRFGRVMHIDLKGNAAKPDYGFFIQPVSYDGGGLIIDPDAPSSNGQMGRLVLAR